LNSRAEDTEYRVKNNKNMYSVLAIKNGFNNIIILNNSPIFYRYIVMWLANYYVFHMWWA